MFSSAKARSQSRAAIAAVRWLFDTVWGGKKPADRMLAAYLREHRELGSRDRRTITELFYSLCRWWGWFKPLAPTGANADDDAWIRPLLAALLMENLDCPELARVWFTAVRIHWSDLQEMPPEPCSAKRATWLVGKLGNVRGPADLKQEALVPWWVPQELECPKPFSSLVSWLQKRPPLWLRIQVPSQDHVIRELEHSELVARKHPRLRNAVSLLKPRVNLMTLPVYSEGRVEVQDLASQAIGHVCAPQPGQRWWDACAGGGGKSLLLSQLMNGKGTVVASDIKASKLDELKRRARRAGYSNITTWEWKGKDVPSQKATFDGVLVDAPCSGSGTWRRNPAARWVTAREDIPRFAALQEEILGHAATGVKPGRLLVYATCSMFRRENEDVVRTFLAKHQEFRLESFTNPLTGDPTSGMVQFWPWDGDCDALFAARMRRK